MRPQRRPARGRAGLRGPAGCGPGRARRRERTGGLADPTLLGALERAGYDRSLAGRPRTAAGGLGGGPARRPARPTRRGVARGDRRRRGRDDRPAARACGSTSAARGKGFVADRAAARSRPSARAPPTAAATCASAARTRCSWRIRSGASRRRAYALRRGRRHLGVDARAWRRRGAAHHLLDPAHGRAGLDRRADATALAPTAAEAEALAKAALLAGPQAGLARLLRRHGGVLVRGRVDDAARCGGDGMTGRGPDRSYGWWLARRAAGLVALR